MSRLLPITSKAKTFRLDWSKLLAFDRVKKPAAGEIRVAKLPSGTMFGTKRGIGLSVAK